MGHLEYVLHLSSSLYIDVLFLKMSFEMRVRCPSLPIFPSGWNGEVMAGATDTILHNGIPWDKRLCVIEDKIEGYCYFEQPMPRQLCE